MIAEPLLKDICFVSFVVGVLLIISAIFLRIVGELIAGIAFFLGFICLLAGFLCCVYANFYYV